MPRRQTLTNRNAVAVPVERTLSLSPGHQVLETSNGTTRAGSRCPSRGADLGRAAETVLLPHGSEGNPPCSTGDGWRCLGALTSRKLRHVRIRGGASRKADREPWLARDCRGGGVQHV